MDVSRTKSFSAPLTGTLARIDVAWREPGAGTTRFDAYAAGRAEFLLPVDGGFDDAVSAAIRLSRRDQSDSAVAVLQSREGSYSLAKLDTVLELGPGLGAEVSARIDGRVEDPLRGPFAPDIAGAHVTRLHQDLRAVVGAYSWVDLRSREAGARQRLPKLG